MFDALSGALVSFAVSVINLFPESPFKQLEEFSASDYFEWLQYLNWFIPVGRIVGIMELWLSGLALYYVYQIVLRWIKVIG